jgi:hypothetical protein
MLDCFFFLSPLTSANNMSAPVIVYHKGQICNIKHQLCQEGFCDECIIFLESQQKPEVKVQIQKCPRCGGKVYEDDKDIVCLPCGWRETFPGSVDRLANESDPRQSYQIVFDRISQITRNKVFNGWKY